MKNFVIALTCLVLVGCATPTGTAPPDISGEIAKVQAITRQVCSFVPTAQTVINILSALGVPGVGAAGAIATQICAAVTTAPLADGGPRAAKVQGVVIQGRWVR